MIITIYHISMVEISFESNVMKQRQYLKVITKIDVGYLNEITKKNTNEKRSLRRKNTINHYTNYNDLDGLTTENKNTNK